MPKVIIREFDNSTTGTSLTNSFAVVVPGFCGDPKPGYDQTEIFDDNGVAELNSQSDFENYIGLLPAGAITKTAAGDSNGYPYTINSAITEADLSRYILCNNDVIDSNTIVGAKYIASKNQVCYYASSTSGGDRDTLIGGIFNLVEAKNQEVNLYSGYLKTRIAVGERNINYDFIPVTSIDDLITEDPIGNKKLAISSAVVLPFDEYGKSGVTAEEKHYGNQIAYELLGLGYTVLYKALDNTAEENATDQMKTADFWAPLIDRRKYNYRYLTAGGCAEAAVAKQMNSIASFSNTVTLENAETFGSSTGRGDVIVLLDIDETNINKKPTKQLLQTMQTAIDKLPSSKYCAIFAPKVTYEMADSEVTAFDGNKTFPASFHYLACAAEAEQTYAEWYAVAGHTRGVAARTVANTSIKFGDIEINTLAPRVKNDYANKAVNLILCEHGNYYLWGNRTAMTISDGLQFSHFLNIRQLCTTIKKTVYSACNAYTFDPNSDSLWTNFTSSIRPVLESMVADQGIKGYSITRVTTDKKAVMGVNIRIIPIEAVEDFDISIYLEDSLTGVIMSSDESE